MRFSFSCIHLISAFKVTSFYSCYFFRLSSFSIRTISIECFLVSNIYFLNFSDSCSFSFSTFSSLRNLTIHILTATQRITNYPDVCVCLLRIHTVWPSCRHSPTLSLLHLPLSQANAPHSVSSPKHETRPSRFLSLPPANACSSLPIYSPSHPYIARQLLWVGSYFWHIVLTWLIIHEFVIVELSHRNW